MNNAQMKNDKNKNGISQLQKNELLPANEIQQLKQLFTLQIDSGTKTDVNEGGQTVKAQRSIYESLVKLRNDYIDINSYQMSKVQQLYGKANLSKYMFQYPKAVNYFIIHNFCLGVGLIASVTISKRLTIKTLLAFALITVNFRIVEKYLVLKNLEIIALGKDMNEIEQQARNILEYKYRIQGTGVGKHIQLSHQVQQLLKEVDQKTEKYYKMQKYLALV